MNKVKFLSILVVILALANLLSIGFMVFMRPHHGPGGHGGPKRMMEEVLRLDETQKGQFHELIKAHHQQFEQLTETAQASHSALLQTFKKDSNSQLEVDSLINQILESRRQVELLNYHHFQDIKAICKPEQRKNFDEMIDKITEFTKRPGRPF